MIYRIDIKEKGAANVHRCTLAFVGQRLKLKPSELMQFRKLRIGEGLDCGTVTVYRVE